MLMPPSQFSLHLLLPDVNEELQKLKNVYNKRLTNKYPLCLVEILMNLFDLSLLSLAGLWHVECQEKYSDKNSWLGRDRLIPCEMNDVVARVKECSTQ